jgi:hypothetical protein
MFYPVCAMILWYWVGSRVAGNPAVNLGDHRQAQVKPLIHEMGGMHDLTVLFSSCGRFITKGRGMEAT